jgi:hypothetical protein
MNIEMILIRLAGLAGIFISIFCGSATAQEKPPKGIKLEIINIRVLSDKEQAIKTGDDDLGMDIALRLRLSAENGLEYFVFKGSAGPLGYMLQVQNDRMVWLYDHGKTKSPGLEGLRYGEWLILPADGAIEWVKLDSTLNVGKKHACTIFIKEKNKIREIISETYTVPSKKELNKK